MRPELEAAELAAYADAFRAAPELCEVVEIDGATCMALRRIPERFFCRVMGLTSTGPLDDIAAFYGDTPWWISDSHGLGAELGEQLAAAAAAKRSAGKSAGSGRPPPRWISSRSPMRFIRSRISEPASFAMRGASAKGSAALRVASRWWRG